MSRTWATQKRSGGWIMMCDFCDERTEARPTEDDFPLIEFGSVGWLIGDSLDACPRCVINGKTVRNSYSQEKLEQDLANTIAHCLKYYGREPLSPYLAERSGAK